MSQSHDHERRFDDEAAATDITAQDVETHATTGGAAAAGAVTGGVIGLAGGPAGVAIGALGGAIIGAAAERLMHAEDESERSRARVDEESASPRIEASSPTMGSSAREERLEREDVEQRPPPR